MTPDSAIPLRFSTRGRGAAKIGPESAQTRASSAGIVAGEGGGSTSHPLGGGVGADNARDPHFENWSDGCALPSRHGDGR